MARTRLSSDVVEVDTAVGTARAHLEGAGRSGLMVLGHGAGGGIEAEDLRAARDGALVAGWTVARVEQPWRVQGRRVAVGPPRLDAAWTAVVRRLRELHPDGGLVLGGRSAGARVACRTASSLDPLRDWLTTPPISARAPSGVRPT